MWLAQCRYLPQCNSRMWKGRRTYRVAWKETGRQTGTPTHKSRDGIGNAMREVLETRNREDRDWEGEDTYRGGGRVRQEDRE